MDELRTALMGEDSVEDEHQLALLDLAADILADLREACEGVDGEDGLVAWAERVERCAGRIADQAIAVRDLLADLGIGACELEATPAGPQDKAGPSLAAALRAAEVEPRRFEKLARLGGAAQRQRVRSAGRWLCTLWGNIEGKAIASRLGLAGEAAEQAAMAIDRLARLILAFEDEIQRPPPGEGAPAPRGSGSPPPERGEDRPPPAEQSPMVG